MDQLEKIEKKSKALVAGLFGAAMMLITMGAGCAAQTDTTVTTEPTPAPTSAPPGKEPAPTPAPEPTPAPTAAPPDKKSSYKDGKYTAKGDYAYHSGSEEVTVTLTLKDDLVVDTTFEAKPSVPMSGKYQQAFSAGYKAMVIGKNMAEVCNLGKVSSSSLTPKGFNDACVKIQAQAKIKA